MLLGSKAENTGSWTLRRSKTRAPKSHLKGFCLSLDTLGGTSQAVLIDAGGPPPLPPATFAGGSPFSTSLLDPSTTLSRVFLLDTLGTFWAQKCWKGMISELILRYFGLREPIFEPFWASRAHFRAILALRSSI